MAQARSRDSGNPVPTSSHEEVDPADSQGGDIPEAIVEDDWNIPATAEEDEAAYRDFLRAQEGPMRRFWEETQDDNL